MYIGIYIYARTLSKVNIKINKVSITVKFSDLFRENGVKVIPVNEYFDTQVDDQVIAASTLHGKYIKQYYSGIESIRTLDDEINLKLKGIKYMENENRVMGKTKKFPIGTAIEVKNKYILTAFTKFDDRNKAYLNADDYVLFLHRFWDEIDRLNNGRIVNVPLIGTGQSRIIPTFSEQDYLEQLIYSIKTSSIASTRCKINIIIHESMKDEISIFKLKNIFR